uniref:Uncharacterized protein n=1 Tax=Lepeophtheirus salmonis TaxID=72036 RepID=A0A0K2TKA0_LEPSM
MRRRRKMECILSRDCIFTFTNYKPCNRFFLENHHYHRRFQQK